MNGVADPGTEEVRFYEFIALEHPEGIEQDQADEASREKDYEPALFVIIEIDHEEALFSRRCSSQPPSLPDNPQNDKRHPDEDEQWQDQEDDEVRIGPRSFCK